MIRVVYHRGYYKLNIDGHAQSGDAGHDLVCAAASILAYTLAANVLELEAMGHVRDMSIDLDPGQAEIKCCPRTRFKAPIQMIYDSICAGFALLAQQYQDNISYEILG